MRSLMNTLPKVAIICANYNYGKYIIPAIESIRNQTYSGSLRLYVIDDGSTDDSWEKICRQKTSRPGYSDDFLHIKKIENSGASVARMGRYYRGS